MIISYNFGPHAPPTRSEERLTDMETTPPALLPATAGDPPLAPNAATGPLEVALVVPANDERRTARGATNASEIPT